MNVANSNSSYRRGVLLGLTMAEIIILVVFLLLLAFAVMLDKERKDSAAKDALLANKGELDRIVRVFSTQPPDMKEDVVKAIESLPSVVSMIKENQLARPNESLPDTIIRAVDKLNDEAKVSSGNSQLPIEEQLVLAQEKIKELEDDSRNLVDQKKNLIAQIEGKGRGVDMPPCWPDANGRATQYLFNVDLTNSGIVLFDAAPAHRQVEKSRLPLSLVRYGQARSISQFQSETKAISDWSRNKNCRFYVFVTDKTGVSEKALFKKLLIAVEGPFYKKLSGETSLSEAKKTRNIRNVDEGLDEVRDERPSFFDRVLNSKKQAKAYN